MPPIPALMIATVSAFCPPRLPPELTGSCASSGIGHRAHRGHTPAFEVRTGVRTTLRWREPDSNHRSRSCERLFWALATEDGGTKGGDVSRRRKLGRVTRDRWFESGFLQR